ncbi:MAG TPA: hypothetical protein VND93_24445 [Myxococcales bacterium]|nr:hypothetical protein [Myxococcales bacterium]
MRIVFDEVMGTVAAPTEQEERAQRQGAPSPTASPTPTPRALARDLRLIAERKARLHAS